MEISSVENIIEAIHNEQLIGFWDWNIPSREKFMSPVFKNMLGYEDDEISNNADIWMQLIHKEDQHKVIKSYQRHIATHGNIAYENTVRYLHKNGSVVQVLSKGKVTEWDFLGNPIRMIGYYANLTSVLKDSSAIQKENEQLKFITDAINPLTWQWNVKTGEITWSQKFYEMLGYNAEEIKPSFFTFFHVLMQKADSEKVRKIIDQHLKNNLPFNTTVIIKHKNGESGWYEIGGKIKRDKDNQPDILFGYVIKKNQTTVANSETPVSLALRERDNRHPGVGEWMYDLANENIIWSNGIYELFELPQTYKPNFENIVQLYSEESREKLQKALNEVVYFQKEYDLDLLCITSKGQKKWVRETGKPVMDKDGNLTGVFGVLEDIDARKKKELTLTESNRQLADRNKRLLNFAQIAAHNLQTHAGNLKTTLQYIDASEDEAERNFFMEAVKKVSDSFNQTLEHLNELVKVEGGVQESKETVYFQNVLDNVLNALNSNITDTKATIQADFSRCPYIRYVPAYLESIMFNLISNAIKYKQENREPFIVVKSYLKNNSKMLVIKDNGRGIDLDKYGSKVFGLYKTFHSNPEAHGIGLFMTKNQVEAMGGSIEIESEPGLGTTFIIHFNESEND